MKQRCAPGCASWRPSARASAIGGCTFSRDGKRPRTERFGGGSTTREYLGCTERKGWQCSAGGASDFEPRRGCRSAGQSKSGGYHRELKPFSQRPLKIASRFFGQVARTHLVTRHLLDDLPVGIPKCDWQPGTFTLRVSLSDILPLHPIPKTKSGRLRRRIDTPRTHSIGWAS